MERGKGGSWVSGSRILKWLMKWQAERALKSVDTDEYVSLRRSVLRGRPNLLQSSTQKTLARTLFRCVSKNHSFHFPQFLISPNRLGSFHLAAIINAAFSTTGLFFFSLRGVCAFLFCLQLQFT